MDIKTQLLAEHSRANADFIKEWIGIDEERFASLVHLFLENEYRVSQRAAMILGHINDTHPYLLQPYLTDIIKHLAQPNIHDAVKRNIVRILQNVEIPEEQYGFLADICFTWLADPNIAVAIRVFSMSVLWNICEKVPELMPELRATIEDWMDYSSTGFQSRGKKVLKMISKYEKKNSIT